MSIGLGRFISLGGILTAALLLPGAASAACAQSDLTGWWRVNLNSGWVLTNNHLLMGSCRIVIRSTGIIEVKGCKALNGTTDPGSLTFLGAPAPLKVTSACNASWGNGSTKMTLTTGNASQSVDKMQLTLSSDKHTLLGFGTYSDFGIMSIEAIKQTP